MRLGAYLILMFSISLALFFMGSEPVGLQLFTLYGAQGGSNLMVGTTSSATLSPATNGVVDKIISTMLPTIGVSGVVAATAVLLTGFGAIYIIPVIILVALLNLFVLPMSVLVDPTVMPSIIGIPLTIFLNLLLTLSVVSFIRGGV